MEVWKEVKRNYNYAVSSLGRVRRLTKACGARPGHILRQRQNNRGYPCVTLCGGGAKTLRPVHQLVAAAFLWPRDGLEVNHIDGDKANNYLDNIELVTHGENMRHAVRTGLFPVGEQVHIGMLCDYSV